MNWPVPITSELVPGNAIPPVGVESTIGARDVRIKMKIYW